MKKFFTILLVSAAAYVQAAEWQIVWSDEFDYSGTPDASRWSFDTQGNEWNWGNDEAQNYTPEGNRNAWVENGNLVIEARKESYYWPADHETKNYTSARLITKNKGDWKYGKFEVRALLPTGNGVWPAIWMLPTDEVYGGWPNSGELDIMENVGFDPLKIHCNIHTGAYNHKNNTNKGNTIQTSAPYENWHVYSLEWYEDNVSFYLDDNLVFSFDKEADNNPAVWPFDQRFHLLLNIAIGGGWGGQEGIYDHIFPQKMLVDYVRVYEQRESSTSIKDALCDHVRVTPNFADEHVNISGIQTAETYQIISIRGEIISQYVTDGEMNVSNLPKGLYFICKNGKRVGSFIKK